LRLIMTTVTEILELYRYVGDTEAAETALTELINESYSEGYSFAKNETELIEEVSSVLVAD
jgi:hypothetical protein